jgi:hypothetical protein
MRRAMCRTAVTRAWSRCAAASSSLRPSRAVCSRLRPASTVVGEVLLAVAFRASQVEACSTRTMSRRGGVTIDRHER